jgi:hypothetical protein
VTPEEPRAVAVRLQVSRRSQADRRETDSLPRPDERRARA